MAEKEDLSDIELDLSRKIEYLRPSRGRKLLRNLFADPLQTVELNFNGVQCDLKLARALRYSLHRAPALRTLNLAKCLAKMASSEEGILELCFIADAVGNHAALRTVDLSWNNYSRGEPAQALGAALARTRHLTALNVSFNPLGRKGVACLIDGVLHPEQDGPSDPRGGGRGKGRGGYHVHGQQTEAKAQLEPWRCCPLRELGLRRVGLGPAGARDVARLLAPAARGNSNAVDKCSGAVSSPVSAVGASTVTNSDGKQQGVHFADTEEHGACGQGTGTKRDAEVRAPSARARPQLACPGSAIAVLDLVGNDICLTPACPATGSCGARKAELCTKGVSALARALARNETLVSLDLGSNGLGFLHRRCIVELATALTQNDTLVSLGLRDNMLDGAAAALLVGALKDARSCSRIAALDMRGNSLLPKGRRAERQYEAPLSADARARADAIGGARLQGVPFRTYTRSPKLSEGTAAAPARALIAQLPARPVSAASAEGALTRWGGGLTLHNAQSARATATGWGWGSTMGWQWDIHRGASPNDAGATARASTAAQGSACREERRRRRLAVPTGSSRATSSSDDVLALQLRIGTSREETPRGAVYAPHAPNRRPASAALKPHVTPKERWLGGDWRAPRPCSRGHAHSHGDEQCCSR